MAKINFAGTYEEVITRSEFSLIKARKILAGETVAVIGYGVQGRAQSLNLKDNGIKVIIGQRYNSKSFLQAKKDGWKEKINLFPIEEAVQRGTIIALLLSDAGQIAVWKTIRKYLTSGKTLYFSHGFGITFKGQSGINPPKNIDVIMVAPKGAGRTVRQMFLKKKGINSSFAVFQNTSGKAQLTVLALGMAIGSGYLFKTTFEKEVYSDLTGERGALMGAIAGIMEAQYAVLRKNGHSPSEAFNETVEEATQSLIPLIGENGMDWMFANCSSTAQRGALDWKDKFKKAVEPVFSKLYKSVKSGKEAKRVIAKNTSPNYRKHLNSELLEMRNSEMWQTGIKVRSLRP